MSMNDPQSSQENVTSLLETLFPESELKLCDENIDSDTPCEDNSNTKSCDEFQRQSPTPMEDIDSLDGIFPRELLAPAVKLAIDELLPLEPTQELSMPMETSEGNTGEYCG
ncbi:uncharacterized protein LOC124368631 [Homalodisca vitripennis]|uniref:uncharacterized protein LOC124368631 n=1 Tax=Homalodisca vitripennis TaxID=197043 RepID=UPI001EEA00B1|nr:uncharacterized protein LOC124368631 [Homalodisca vitripennis]